MILAHKLYGAVDHGNPVIHAELEILSAAVGGHGKSARGNLIDVEDGERSLASGNLLGVPERLSLMLRAIVEEFLVVEIVSDLEADHSALGSQLFQKPFRHISWNVIEFAK